MSLLIPLLLLRKVVRNLGSSQKATFRLHLLLSCLLIAAPLISGCGAGLQASSPQSNAKVAVSPSSAVVSAGTTQQYTASVSGLADTRVTWLVQNIRGGNSTVGTISASGLFNAPGTLTSSVTETITAVSASSPSVRSSVSVNIHGNAGVSVSLSPVTATVRSGLQQQFAANVKGSSNKSVTWLVNNVPGGSSTLGIISSMGLYTAPATPPTNPVSVTAASNADPTKSASATVNVTTSSSPSTISVAVAPTSATVQTGLTRQFSATVTGTTNTAVMWSVNQIQGGNSSVGTISSTGLYTAPASVPANASVTVQAASYQNSGASGAATVLIASAPTAGVSVSLSPLTATVRSGLQQQFTATVKGSSDTSVTWLVNNVPGGSSTFGIISSVGLYTAPATPPTNPVSVTAVSNADPTKSASATVNVTTSSSPSTISVAVAPTSATVQTGLTRQFSATVTGTTNTAVMWSVNQIQGGNSSVGTISSTGLYTAPASVPANASVTVQAASYQNSGASGAATVLIASAPTAGVDYYVAPTGSDSNNGSTAHPWATISHAASLAQPGWIIHVAPGVYSGPLTTSASGTSSAHIRYISDTQWGAMIQCASGVSCNQVWTQSGNYVDMLGFEITSLNTTTQEGVFWYGSNGLIQGNKVHDIGCVGAGSNGGAAINTRPGANYITIDANLAYNVGLGTGYNTVHGIYINTSQYVTVSNNLVFNNEVWGILFHHATGAYYATIVNNTVFNNAGGIVIEGKTSSYVANNILAYNTRNIPNFGTKDALYECCQTNTGATNIYTNNLFYQNSATYQFLDSAAANANPVTGNPNFVKYTGDETGDYHIAVGTSPAVDAGASSHAPTTDFDGGARPVNSVWDIGAYEFGNAAAIWPWD